MPYLSDAPLWSFGPFVPSALTLEIVITEFRQYMSKFFPQTSAPILEDRQEVRDPKHYSSALNILHRNYHPLSTNVRNWHQDSGGSDEYVLLWANVVPTELTPIITRFDLRPHEETQGSIITVKPCEVIVFANKMFQHRAPHMPDAIAAQRWFIRVFITKTQEFGVQRYRMQEQTLKPYIEYKDDGYWYNGVWMTSTERIKSFLLKDES